jgi:hypothetical protein
MLKVHILFAKVKAAEFTTNKISGLDVKTREDYLGIHSVRTYR